MEITFDRYIDNPSGTSVVTNKSMYKNMYQDKFNKILLREGGQVKYFLYTTKNEAEYIVHMKIPSEVISDFYYDVVIRFYTTKNEYKNEANLRRYYVNFFSNDPAFVYTFAHSFYKNKIFVEDLIPKMSKEAIKHDAKVKNPKNEVWYVKSLYFAYLTMEKYSLFSKAKFRINAKPYNKKALLTQITPADLKIQQRQSEAEKLRKAERVEKKPSTPPKYVNTKHIAKQSKGVKTSMVSKVSKTAKATKSSKRSNTI